MSNSVVELFAGVGGFHLAAKQSGWNVIWANQWEPGVKVQHAFDCYTKNFPDTVAVNDDIANVIRDIPKHDLLVGGFPCQDYSVATTLKNSKGLIGKKGVLWWAIHRILDEKGSKRPKYLFLENVDRLLKSPSSQRGRDFAVMLKSLDELGYAVEWRVINAADYGMPQRRRRVFIFAAHKKTNIYKNLNNILREQGIRTSFFIDPIEDQLKSSIDCGVECVEFHMGKYCRLFYEDNVQAEIEFKKIYELSVFAYDSGLEVHLGHGLDFITTKKVTEIPCLQEVNIGFFLVAESIFSGLDSTIRKMKDICDRNF